MIGSQKFRDLELAYKLHQEQHCLGITENAVLPKDNGKENYKPRTLIDQTLELIDPTPNVHTLFMQFNQKYFWNVLLPVEVRWSARMTSCAGVCTFHPRNRQCVISLSAPLLKLRPRKDLIETLLHEMIHGYLFLTNNNRDRDGHGPEFCKHMDRINREAGTKITIYHSFHEEVKLYQQHWWRCNGPCQKRAPYFGMVRRSMNRAPGPNDFWWQEHKYNCGGQYIKVKEPENYKGKGSKNKPNEKPVIQNDKTSDVLNWLLKTPSSKTEQKATFTPTNIKSNTNAFKKLGNGTNNVHGWGTGGPNSLQKNSSISNTKTPTGPSVSRSGVLGGSNLGRSNLLDKLYNNNGSPTSTALSKKTFSSSTNINVNINVKIGMETGPVVNTKRSNDIQIKHKLVECPVCSKFVSDDEINTHVDSCLMRTNKSTETKEKNRNNDVNCQGRGNSLIGQKRKNSTDACPCTQPKLCRNQNNEVCGSKKANCPICNKNYDLADINEHLDKCLLEKDERNNSIIIIDDEENMNRNIPFDNNDPLSTSPILAGSKDFRSSPMKFDTIIKTTHSCLVCNQLIPIGTSLNDHLEDCIGNVFNDESTLLMETDNNETLLFEKSNNHDESTLLMETDNNKTLVLEEPKKQDHKYPCPVCMQLITDILMNEHLDVCLATR
ncbi:sprT-like domain-containing protein Spartan [Ceratina calcarata]|uniref:Protein with SprT-like domain at the N terminus n=1 Tax=Ceratina calcarata TaxID=156304 RepID=A0AAJ7IUG2_9HYME|nr:sprT-like domain-containing protein Spartan [Ceratina calcarata]